MMHIRYCALRQENPRKEDGLDDVTIIHRGIDLQNGMEKKPSVMYYHTTDTILVWIFKLHLFQTDFMLIRT